MEPKKVRSGFTSQLPQIATERDLNARWGGDGPGNKFRCGLCNYKFQLNDYWRWVYTNDIPGAGGNPFICKNCDDRYQMDRLKIAEEFAKDEFALRAERDEAKESTKYDISINYLNGWYSNPKMKKISEKGAMDGGFTIGWSAKNFGFGQLAFTMDNDKIICDNECMGKNFIRQVLLKLVEESNLISDLEKNEIEGEKSCEK